MARHRWRNCAATGFALRAIKHKKRPTENPNLAQSKVCWPLGRVESRHFCEVGGLEASYSPAKMQGSCCASRAQKKGAMTEQIKERREKREERKWPPARFSAFLRCPVNTLRRTEKTTTSVRRCFSQNCGKAEGAQKRVASSIPSISTVSHGHHDGSQNAAKKKVLS